MRREDWPERLFAEVDRQSALPFEWGKSDCFTFVTDCVKAVIDEDISKGRPEYDSPLKAKEALKKRGFSNLGQAFASRFEEVHVVDAQRGDIGIAKGKGLTGVVFLGETAVGKDEELGVRHISRDQVSRAFRVE